jgi:hypothetical protein
VGVANVADEEEYGRRQEDGVEGLCVWWFGLVWFGVAWFGAV